MIAILGTGGAAGSWLNKWLRDRREDRVRWHSERRAAYERFLTAAERFYEVELVISEHIGNLRSITGWGQDPLFDEEHLLRVADKIQDDWTPHAIGKVRSERPVANDAREKMESSLAAIEMISIPLVVDAARSHRDAVRSVIALAADSPPRECGGWSEDLVLASEFATETRDALVDAIRKELGVAE